MAEGPTLLWFRRDLRLTDHPAVEAAVAAGGPVIPVFVLDDGEDGLRPLGGASKWWLDKSLRALSEALEALGSRLVVRRGASAEVLPALAREADAVRAVWARSYEPGAMGRDDAVERELAAAGVACERTQGSFLVEPGSVLNGSGEPYRIFAPWWRAAQRSLGDVRILPAPARLPPPEEWPDGLPAESWELHPTGPDWSTGFSWTAGEAAAQSRLDAFMADGAGQYHQTRDIPAEAGSTRLSPHLTWGEIGARQIWVAAHAAGLAQEARDKLLSEVAWRDFNWQLLSAHPEVVDQPFRRELARLAVREAPDEVRAFVQGRTGYPIVDAGMRELWIRGWMPNRLRLIAGSFLVKHLLVDWRVGERWFWDTLIDADPANNPLNWQWIAGSGPDAQPFNRIFNPLLQAEKFDGEGRYVRRWVPELARLPDAFVHKPWEAPPAVLAEAGVELGVTYPRPIVEHGAARARALEGYRTLKR